jgi:nitrate reductase NapE component
MAKGTKASLIGSVGGVFIGAALLLFIATIILGSLKNNQAGIGTVADRASVNTTITTLMSFLTIGVVLFGVLGITMVGAAIIGYITGAFA